MSLQITVDAQSPAVLARFWAAALPGYEVRAYDDREVARLAALGLTPETDPSVPIDSAGQPTVWFQKSDSTPTSRNRIHFDLAFADLRSEVQRLTELGAIVYAERNDHVVMLDPEGNQFCVFDRQ